MKILHVIDSLDLYRGGPVVCVASIAAAQAMQGNHITVIAYELNDADKFNDFLKLNVPGYENVNFLYIEGNSALEKLCARNASVVLKDVIPHVDIVHIHGIWSPILYSASKISIKYGKKYVVTPHGMLNPWSLSHKKFKKLIALLLVWKNIIRNSYFVHALNDEEKKFIGLLNITLKINVVSNGVFEESFSKLSTKDLFLSEHRSLNGKKFILFISRLHYVKGLDYLVNAFSLVTKLMHDVDLVIAGPDEGERKSLMELIEKLELSKKVHVIGPIYNEMKYSALMAAECFCLPSRQEGFSIAITEAMACGLPVIISKECNFNEVNDVSAGFVVDLDASQIAKAMTTIVTDKNLAVKMGKNGRDLILTKYTGKNIANKLIEIYE